MGQIQAISALHQKPGQGTEPLTTRGYLHHPRPDYARDCVEACLVETELPPCASALSPIVRALVLYLHTHVLAAPSDVDTIVLQRDAFLGELGSDPGSPDRASCGLLPVAVAEGHWRSLLQ